MEWPTYLQIPCLRKGQILLCKKHSDSTKKSSVTDVTKSLEFWIDSIFVLFGGPFLEQDVGNPKGINCVPLLAGWLGYSYAIDPHTRASQEKPHEDIPII